MNRWLWCMLVVDCRPAGRTQGHVRDLEWIVLLSMCWDEDVLVHNPMSIVVCDDHNCWRKMQIWIDR